MKEKSSKKVLHLIQEVLDRINIINQKTTREIMYNVVTEDNNNNNNNIRGIKIDRV